MTADDLAGDGDTVTTLQELIRVRMSERGWTYVELSRRSDGALTDGRWQQLGSGVRQKRLPEADSIIAMARALEVDETTVLLAAAKSVGIPVTRGGSAFAQLLPSGIDALSPRLQESFLKLIRDAVADAVEAQRRIDVAEGRGETDNGPPRGLRALGE